MAWKDGFVLEYTSAGDPAPENTLSCRNCSHFDEDDRSCEVTGKVFREEGYGAWSDCKFFKLSSFFKTAKNIKLLEAHCERTGIQLVSWDPNHIVGIRCKSRVWHKKSGVGVVVNCSDSVVTVKFLSSQLMREFSIP